MMLVVCCLGVREGETVVVMASLEVPVDGAPRFVLRAPAAVVDEVAVVVPYGMASSVALEERSRLLLLPVVMFGYSRLCPLILSVAVRQIKDEVDRQRPAQPTSSQGSYCTLPRLYLAASNFTPVFTPASREYRHCLHSCGLVLSGSRVDG